MKYEVDEHLIPFDTKTFIENYPKRYEDGFTNDEVNSIIEIVEDLRVDFNKELFNKALNGITCMVIEDQTVIYTYDVELALRCGLRGYGITANEWD